MTTSTTDVVRSDFDLPSALLPDFEKASLYTAHALLIEGPKGNGQFELAYALSQARLCEANLRSGLACGHCTSCKLIAAKTHPDFRLLAPEAWMLAHDWPLPEAVQKDLDGKKRKPSKEIKVDAVRSLVEFTQRTAARAQGRVVLIYPAEGMNMDSANMLLKTLEEPPVGLSFLLASEATFQLLPTVRSRCLSYPLAYNPALAAVSIPSKWQQLPLALKAGESSLFKDHTPSEAVTACLALCHDLWLRHFEQKPHFFDESQLPTPPSLAMLNKWHRLLLDMMRSIEHPFKLDLFIENLCLQSQRILNSVRA